MAWRQRGHGARWGGESRIALRPCGAGGGVSSRSASIRFDTGGSMMLCQESRESAQFSTPVDAVGSSTGSSSGFLRKMMKRMAVGAVRNRVLCGFASSLWARSLRPWGASASMAPGAGPAPVRPGSAGSGRRRGVRVWLCPRALVTAQSSDRPSRSLLCCPVWARRPVGEIAPRTPEGRYRRPAPRTLVTAQSSDRPSRSLLCCPVWARRPVGETAPRTPGVGSVQAARGGPASAESGRPPRSTATGSAAAPRAA